MADAKSAVEPHTQVEERVLGMISEASVRTSDLMNRAHDLGSSSAEVRETVWSLLDDGRLQAHRRPPSEAALMSPGAI
jgi:hypothetical protein